MSLSRLALILGAAATLFAPPEGAYAAGVETLSFHVDLDSGKVKRASHLEKPIPSSSPWQPAPDAVHEAVEQLRQRATDLGLIEAGEQLDPLVAWRQEGTLALLTLRARKKGGGPHQARDWSVAVDLESGRLLWQRPLGRARFGVNPWPLQIAQGAWAVPGHERIVFVELQSGTDRMPPLQYPGEGLLWMAVDGQGGLLVKTAKGRSAVPLAQRRGIVRRLNLASGKLLWQQEAGSYAVPLLSRNRLVDLWIDNHTRNPCSEKPIPCFEFRHDLSLAEWDVTSGEAKRKIPLAHYPRFFDTVDFHLASEGERVIRVDAVFVVYE